MPNVESIYILSSAQAGMFAVLCMLGVRSRPARNLLLLSPAAVSLAGLLYWAPPAARAEAGQRQGRGRARGLQEAFLGPGQPSTSWPSCSCPAAPHWSCPALALAQPPHTNNISWGPVSSYRHNPGPHLSCFALAPTVHIGVQGRKKVVELTGGSAVSLAGGGCCRPRPLLRQIDRKQWRSRGGLRSRTRLGSLTLYNGHSVVISYVIVIISTILTYSYSTILLNVPFRWVPSHEHIRTFSKYIKNNLSDFVK